MEHHRFDEAQWARAARANAPRPPSLIESLQQRANALTGWQRVGVVLSLAWIIFWLGFQAVIVIFDRFRVSELSAYIAFLIFPIAALWGGGYGVSAAYRWVRGGFPEKRDGTPFMRSIANRIDMPIWGLVAIILISLVIGILVAPHNSHYNDADREGITY